MSWPLRDQRGRVNLEDTDAVRNQVAALLSDAELKATICELLLACPQEDRAQLTHALVRRSSEHEDPSQLTSICRGVAHFTCSCRSIDTRAACASRTHEPREVRCEQAVHYLLDVEDWERTQARARAGVCV